MSRYMGIEKRAEPFWIQVAPYVLALFGLITAIGTWALTTQASQDEKITKLEQHAIDTDKNIYETLKEIKEDVKEIKGKVH
jgi:CHASE1-domain containing sensor protein